MHILLHCSQKQSLIPTLSICIKITITPEEEWFTTGPLSHICINNDLNDSFAVQYFKKVLIYLSFNDFFNPVFLIRMYITECFSFPSTSNPKEWKKKSLLSGCYAKIRNVKRQNHKNMKWFLLIKICCPLI